MTKQTPEPNEPVIEPLSRRRLLKIGAASGVAGAGLTGHVSDRLDPAREAQAVAATTAVGLTIVAGFAGAAVGKAMSDGNSVDKEAYQEAQESEEHNMIFEDATKMKGDHQLLFDTFNDVRDLTSDAAVQDGSSAAIDAMLRGDSQQATIDAATAQVDTYYTTIEENLLTQWNKKIVDLRTLVDTVDQSSVLGLDQVFDANVLGGSSGSTISSIRNLEKTRDVTLIDGSSYATEAIDFTSNTDSFLDVSLPQNALIDLIVEPPDTGGTVKPMQVEQYTNTRDTIKENHTTAVDNVTTLVENIYPDWENGLISEENLIAASDLASISQEASSFSEANAATASLGVPISDPAVKVELSTVDGGTKAYPGELAMRFAPEDGLPVGEEINPDDYEGLIYFSYNYENADGEMVGTQTILRDPFTIVESESDPVTFSDPVNRITSTDLSADEYSEKVTSYHDAEQKAREKQTEIVVESGGGGLFGGFDPFGSTKNTVMTVAVAGGGLIAIDKATDNSP